MLGNSIFTAHIFCPSVVIPDGLQDDQQVDREEAPCGHAQPRQGFPGGRPVLGVVVGVEGDDADAYQKRGANYADKGLLKKDIGNIE